MITSEKGLDLIKTFEGLRLEAYRCPAGIWTIGYGHTAGVQPGTRITREQADALLREDVSDAERAVRERVTSPLNQNRYDALVSFVYNVGTGAFARSALLRVVNADPDNVTEVRRQLLRWNRAGGKELPGLTRRRKAEADMYGI